MENNNYPDEVARKWKAERDGFESALRRISQQKGFTMLANCCVNRACSPAYDDGQEMHCTHQWGVSRGNAACAQIADEALAEHIPVKTASKESK